MICFIAVIAQCFMLLYMWDMWGKGLIHTEPMHPQYASMEISFILFFWYSKWLKFRMLTQIPQNAWWHVLCTILREQRPFPGLSEANMLFSDVNTVISYPFVQSTFQQTGNFQTLSSDNMLYALLSHITARRFVKALTAYLIGGMAFSWHILPG